MTLPKSYIVSAEGMILMFQVKGLFFQESLYNCVQQGCIKLPPYCQFILFAISGSCA